MNNEPVAIVNTNCENNIQWYDKDPKEHNGYFLYTHPAKTLTDAEIMESCHAYHYTYNPDYLGFAREILRKASEK